MILGVTDGEESGGGEEGAAEGVTAGWAGGGRERVCMYKSTSLRMLGFVTDCTQSGVNGILLQVLRHGPRVKA